MVLVDGCILQSNFLQLILCPLWALTWDIRLVGRWSYLIISPGYRFSIRAPGTMSFCLNGYSFLKFMCLRDLVTFCAQGDQSYLISRSGAIDCCQHSVCVPADQACFPGRINKCF